MLASDEGGEPPMGTVLPVEIIPHAPAQGLFEFRMTERSRGSFNHHGQQFVQHAVQADDGRRFAFIEMTADGLADIGPELFPSVGFGNDGVAEGAGDEAAVSFVTQ